MRAMSPNTATEQPKVSVVITAYNREQYIAQAIESVLGQTFSDLELIVVDDCSSDRTATIAQSYAPDPRVRVYVNECNLGQFPNRNHAATLARGAFLKFHDSDDLLYPHCLEVMVGALESESRAAIAVSCFKRWVGGPCPVLSTPAMTFRRDLLGAEGIMWAAPGHLLFRTDVFRDLGCFPELGAFSDSLFLVQACAKVDVVLVPADLFWYRLHPQQEPVVAGDWALRCATMWKMLKGGHCPLTGADLEQAKRNWCWRVGRYSWEEIIRGRWRAGLTIARGSGISAPEWLHHLRRPRRSDAAGVPINKKGEYPVPERLSISSSDQREDHSLAHMSRRSGEPLK
jgi:glycosyltransferase involved in cell wall biosynthesis